MKKIFLFFLLFTQLLNAQSFTEVVDTPFEGVQFSSIAVADVDGDSDEDILITGRGLNVDRIAKLYKNDGNGQFTEVMNTPFEGVQFGSVAFADVDGDTDLDVLITGNSVEFISIAKLYLNDGIGNFTEVMNTPFESVREGSIAFSDIDGDTDQDVIIMGRNDNNNSSTKLYVNDGLGSFTENTNSSIDNVQSGAIAFADVDGDNDEDVFIIGSAVSAGLEPPSKLYINDGMGNFTVAENTPFIGLEASSAIFFDTDGDADKDLLISGFDGESMVLTELYSNDGMGNFTVVENTLVDLESRSVGVSDVDGDNDLDLVMIGSTIDNVFTKLYLNDGLGNFNEIMGTSFEDVFVGSIAFSDVDGDTDEDLFITGLTLDGTRIAKLYTNDRIMTSIENKYSNGNSPAFIYPNPSSNSESLYLDYPSERPIELQLSLFDISGKQIFQQNVKLSSEQNKIPIKASTLTSGIYFIEVQDGLHTNKMKFIVR